MMSHPINLSHVDDRIKRLILAKISLVTSIPLVIFLLLAASPFSSAETTVITPNDQIQSFRPWSKLELTLIKSLWIGNLQPAKDPSNKHLNNPVAAQLGQKIFFDPRFSQNGKVSCSSCHQPELNFTDGLSKAEGVGKTNRNSPSIIGTIHSPWQFWDGRKDSQWSQALGPIESPVEHGSNRNAVAQLIASDTAYRSLYQEVFGKLPDLSNTNRFPLNAGPINNSELATKWEKMGQQEKIIINTIFANSGKALSAFEATIKPAPSRFDRYIEALLTNDNNAAAIIFNNNEIAGLRLFIGRGNCTNCHNGPLLTSHDFQNIGLANNSSKGRLEAISQIINDPFNCFGDYSDASKTECNELRFIKKSGDDLIGAFKVPSLRNVANTAPYIHDGRFDSLYQVLEHYNKAPKPESGISTLHPLNLTEDKLLFLEAFLKTLSDN